MLSEYMKSIVNHYVVSRSHHPDLTQVAAGISVMTMDEVRNAQNYMFMVSMKQNIGRGFLIKCSTLCNALFYSLAVTAAADLGYRGYKFFNPANNTDMYRIKIILFVLTFKLSLSLVERCEKYTVQQQRLNQINSRITRVDRLLLDRQIALTLERSLGNNQIRQPAL